MTIVSLAIETTHGLINSIELAHSPEEAVAKFIRDLTIVPDEQIVLVLATVLKEGDTTDEEDREFEVAVEQLFEAAVPEHFHEEYVWTAAA